MMLPVETVVGIIMDRYMRMAACFMNLDVQRVVVYIALKMVDLTVLKIQKTMNKKPILLTRKELK
jgi:hypothetical protein